MLLLKLKDIENSIHCNTVVEGEKDFIENIIASSLISDVLIVDKENILLITNLASPQIVRTADMIGANMVLLTNGKVIPEDMLKAAKEVKIYLLQTDLMLFEACYQIGKLYFEKHLL